MNPIKRFGRAALLLALGVLLAGSPALAAELCNTGVEPDASGTVTYTKYVTVKCEGLRPRSTYAVVWYWWSHGSFLGTPFESEGYEVQAVETDNNGRLTARVPYKSSYRSSWGGSSTTRWFECVENDADPPQVVLW